MFENLQNIGNAVSNGEIIKTLTVIITMLSAIPVFMSCLFIFVPVVVLNFSQYISDRVVFSLFASVLLLFLYCGLKCRKIHVKETIEVFTCRALLLEIIVTFIVADYIRNMNVIVLLSFLANTYFIILITVSKNYKSLLFVKENKLFMFFSIIRYVIMVLCLNAYAIMEFSIHLDIIMSIWIFLAVINAIYKEVCAQKDKRKLIVKTIDETYISNSDVKKKSGDMVEFGDENENLWIVRKEDINYICYTTYKARHKQGKTWRCKITFYEEEKEVNRIHYINNEWIELTTYFETTQQIMVVAIDKVKYLKRKCKNA